MARLLQISFAKFGSEDGQEISGIGLRRIY